MRENVEVQNRRRETSVVIYQRDIYKMLFYYKRRLDHEGTYFFILHNKHFFQYNIQHSIAYKNCSIYIKFNKGITNTKGSGIILSPLFQQRPINWVPKYARIPSASRLKCRRLVQWRQPV